ncbi:hypothetical protein ACOMHN_004047 [Nucella lapillus]
MAGGYPQGAAGCDGAEVGLRGPSTHPVSPLARTSLVQDFAHHRHVADVDEHVIEARLLQQQQESAADAKWLQAEEKSLKRDKWPVAQSEDSDSTKENSPPPHHPSSSQHPPQFPPPVYQQIQHTQAVTVRRTSTDSRSSSTSDSTEGGAVLSQKSQSGRANDRVYDSTTSVVRAVMTMTKEAPAVEAQGYLTMVRTIGQELRSLLASVDEIVGHLPQDNMKQIEMAQKVLSTDMASLVSSMKLAQQYSTTPLDGEYRKRMLKAAHALAMDSKNLLDTVDTARSATAAAAPVLR